MMQNHTAANQQLTLIATGLGLDMSNALDSEHERLREKLQTLHGKAFDNQYMRDIVADHDKHRVTILS